MGGEDVLFELAARLGSPVRFDRHGRVVWMDGFEEGISKWATSPQGSGAAAELDSTQARTGGYSCKLTTGSDGLQFVAISKLLVAPMVARYGVEVSFTFDEDLDRILLALNYQDGSVEWQHVLRYVVDDDELQYYDVNKAYQALAPTVPLRESVGLFHTLKLVIDPLEKKYVRALLDDRYFDLADIAAPSVALVEARALGVAFTIDTDVAANVVSYVDDVIVTENEP